MKYMISLIAGLVAVSGCAERPAQVVTIDTACYTFAPIIPEPEDMERLPDNTPKLSASLERQILTHNLVGARRCNWKPNHE